MMGEYPRSIMALALKEQWFHVTSDIKYPITHLKISLQIQEGVMAPLGKKVSMRVIFELDDDGSGLHCLQWSHQKASVVC